MTGSNCADVYVMQKRFKVLSGSQTDLYVGGWGGALVNKSSASAMYQPIDLMQFSGFNYKVYSLWFVSVTKLLIKRKTRTNYWMKH